MRVAVEGKNPALDKRGSAEAGIQSTRHICDSRIVGRVLTVANKGEEVVS